MYIFTDSKVKQILAVKQFLEDETGGGGSQALAFRKELEKKLKITVVAWCQMGGDNEPIEWD